MLYIRPIHSKDIDGLMKLLDESGHGLTSLPKDRTIISKKIFESERSFEHRGDVPNGESYLFVMVDSETGDIAGVSGIISKIGGFEPYYFYRLKEEIRTSKMLNLQKRIKTLHVEKVHSGPAEICSLFLGTKYRNSPNGRFLSQARFLFIAEDRKFFEDTIIAELRGQVNEHGHSPFWEAVGRKFMDIDFAQADYLTMKSKSFIEELLPETPILLDLIPKKAQQVVGEVHQQTEPAKRILTQEGFEFSGLVGIFEPGPVVKCLTDEVRTIKECRIENLSGFNNELSEKKYLISTVDAAEFRVCIGDIEISDNGVLITKEIADILQVEEGEAIRFAPLRPQVKKH